LISPDMRNRLQLLDTKIFQFKRFAM
jgi:hypothetical protein